MSLSHLQELSDVSGFSEAVLRCDVMPGCHPDVSWLQRVKEGGIESVSPRWERAMFSRCLQGRL